MQRLAERKCFKVRYLLFLLAISVFIGGCGSSESSPEWNITGTWSTFYATNGTPGEQGPNPFTFQTNGNTVGGSTSQGQAITGKIEGVDITFSFVGSDGFVNDSKGTVGADGSTMSGTWTSANQKSGTWHAVINLTPQVNISGNWNVYQTTSGVAGEQGPDDFTFTQSGYGIAGVTADGRPVTGAIGRLDVTFFWVGSDEVTHTMTGLITAEGTSMSGTWYDTNGKSGTWRAIKG